jgi:hypothetical protein
MSISPHAPIKQYTIRQEPELPNNDEKYAPTVSDIVNGKEPTNNSIENNITNDGRKYCVLLCKSSKYIYNKYLNRQKNATDKNNIDLIQSKLEYYSKINNDMYFAIKLADAEKCSDKTYLSIAERYYVDIKYDKYISKMVGSKFDSLPASNHSNYTVSKNENQGREYSTSWNLRNAVIKEDLNVYGTTEAEIELQNDEENITYDEFVSNFKCDSNAESTTLSNYESEKIEDLIGGYMVFPDPKRFNDIQQVDNLPKEYEWLSEFCDVNNKAKLSEILAPMNQQIDEFSRYHDCNSKILKNIKLLFESINNEFNSKPLLLNTSKNLNKYEIDFALEINKKRSTAQKQWKNKNIDIVNNTYNIIMEANNKQINEIQPKLYYHVCENIYKKLKSMQEELVQDLDAAIPDDDESNFSESGAADTQQVI